MAGLGSECCPRGWALTRHSLYLVTPFSDEAVAQPRAFLLASREHADRVPPEVFGSPVPTRAWECSLRISALLPHGCWKQGARTLCCTHRPQNSQGETSANPALSLSVLHQSLHQQASQPCQPLAFLPLLGSWAVGSPMGSASWYLTTSHRALVGDRVLGCARGWCFMAESR